MSIEAVVLDSEDTSYTDTQRVGWGLRHRSTRIFRPALAETDATRVTVARALSPNAFDMLVLEQLRAPSRDYFDP